MDLATWKPPLPALEPLEAGAEEAVGIAAFDAAEDGPAPGEDAVGAPGEEGEARDARREAREIAALLALDVETRRSRLEEARQRLESLGDVNLGAIEEHEELRERFRFLDEQRADLEASLAQLREAIARINRTSRKRFRETFDAVNERFQQNFPRLFRGGKALAHAHRDGGRARGGHRDHRAAARQAAPEREPALGRREDDDGDRAAGLGLPGAARRRSSCSTRWTPRSTTPTSGASTRS